MRVSYLFVLSFLACSSSNESVDTAASAVSDGDGGVSSAANACLSTYVGCVRDGGDVETCRKALHDCARDNHGHESCDHPDKQRHHPPPPDGAPPPLDGAPPDGGPPPPRHPHGPPPAIVACLDQIDACAKGNDTIETCVANALGCLIAAHEKEGPPRE